MTLVSTLLTVGLTASATGCLLWALSRTVRRREAPSAKPFIALLAVLALWAAASLCGELPAIAPADAVSTLCSSVRVTAAFLLPGVWVAYARSYTGRRLSRRWTAALFASLVLPLVWGGVVLATASSETAIERRLAPLVGMELLVAFCLYVYGTYVMVSFGGDHPRVSNAQVAVVTGGVTAPYLLELARDSSEPVGGASVGLLVAGALLAVAVRRYPVTTGFPKADHVARTRVVETLREAVLVLDSDGYVLDANEAAADRFGEGAELVGEPLETVADGLGDADLSAGSNGTVSLRTPEGRRRFQFSVSGVSDSAGGGEPVARTVLLRDVTDRRTRRQRLSVLNRILRHNVRNDLDAVLAHTNRIDDEDVRTEIRTILDRTVRLGTKARETEEVMSALADPPTTVDLAAVARSVADRFRSDVERGEIELDATAIEAVTHEAVVRRLLRELLENALEHADSDAPNVRITVRAGPGETAELVVADDGPGIPDREREILAAGAETQAKHGRGIGLWFVRWAVTQLGGELAFDRNDPTGSIVTVRLYANGA
ncbi:ATP-binding protein [Natronomonas sp.]|uniref:ATP-binding protein n=1 Tax=Natronomonas sp. TaxID=2184060 RepID=UPI0026129D89|nr:ATP-binding protein [Natronomonas sp.]